MRLKKYDESRPFVCFTGNQRPHLECVSVQVLLLPPETSIRHAAATATTTTVSGVRDAAATTTTTTNVRDAATASRRRSRGGEIKKKRCAFKLCERRKTPV